MNSLTKDSLSLLITFSLAILFSYSLKAADAVGIWMKFEKEFQSSKLYENPLDDVKKFVAHFTSPTGRTKNINGFWDGEKSWKVRFCPDELGTWKFTTECSDDTNTGLHNIISSFECVPHQSKLAAGRQALI